MELLPTLLIALITLVIGFLAGWLVEWRIDLAYWRSYFKEADEANEAPMMVLPAGAAAPQLPPAGQELLLETLRGQVAQRDADLATLRGTLEQLTANEGHWRAREGELTDENRRLRQQLDELGQARDEADGEWRHELARREAQWQESKEAELAALRAEVERLTAASLAEKSQVEAEWRAEAARREAQWQAAQAAELNARIAENERLAAALADVEQRFARYKDSHPATLADITGITANIEDELRRAGIHTYHDLSRRTPEDLQALLNPPKWRRHDFEAWIAQARRLAAESEA